METCQFWKSKMFLCRIRWFFSAFCKTATKRLISHYVSLLSSSLFAGTSFLEHQRPDSIAKLIKVEFLIGKCWIHGCKNIQNCRLKFSQKAANKSNFSRWHLVWWLQQHSRQKKRILPKNLGILKLMRNFIEKTWKFLKSKSWKFTRKNLWNFKMR